MKDPDAGKLLQLRQSDSEWQQMRKDSFLKCIPERYRSASFDFFDCSNKSQQKVVKILQRFSMTFSERLQKGTCLIFTGHIGSGKTSLACALAKKIIGQGYCARYVTCSQLLMQIKLAGWQKESYEVQQWVQPELLLIDETPTEDFSATDKRRLFQIIDGRYAKKMCTAIISNLNVDGLKQSIGHRAVDRLLEDGVVLTFDWGSFRTKETI